MTTDVKLFLWSVPKRPSRWRQASFIVTSSAGTLNLVMADGKEVAVKVDRSLRGIWMPIHTTGMNRSTCRGVVIGFTKNGRNHPVPRPFL